MDSIDYKLEWAKLLISFQNRQSVEWAHQCALLEAGKKLPEGIQQEFWDNYYNGVRKYYPANALLHSERILEERNND